MVLQISFALLLEQYVFDRMDRAKEYLMLWQNSNAVIVGKNQDTLTAVMTNSGPGTATTLASIDIYKAAFENFTFGKASASK